MKKTMDKVLLERIAKHADPAIIINYPWCPALLHQPKRPDSLRRDADNKKETN